MPDLVFVLPDGIETVVDAPVGESVMRIAVNHDLPGVVGECGGELSCATCHVFDRQLPDSVFGSSSEDESDLLEMVENLRPTSRLACQMHMTAEAEGCVIEIPDEG